MKLRKLTAFCLALLLDNAGRSSGQTAELKQELGIYGVETQIGTIAQRTFSDAKGRVLKTISYGSTTDAKRPYTEAMLVPVRIDIYKYDDQDRVIRSEAYNSKMILRSYTETRYINEHERRDTSYTAAGVRTYETRRVAGSTVCELYFDETGKQLTAIRGAIPRDIDLPFGWGETENG